MSLCFALNMSDSVYIAADGRKVKLEFNKDGYLVPTEVVSEEYRKVRPLTKNSILFIGGICHITEKMYDEIRSMVNDNSSFKEILDVIQKISQKYHKLSGFTSDADKTSSTASVLAYYGKTPMYAGLSPQNNYEPLIFNKHGQYGFKGDLIGETEGLKFFSSFQKITDKNILECIYKAYQHVSKHSFAVAGLLRIYKIDKDGVNLIEKRMI